jgi:hypothetical protein
MGLGLSAELELIILSPPGSRALRKHWVWVSDYIESLSGVLRLPLKANQLSAVLTSTANTSRIRL